ncbi:MAG: hypothetical protein U1E36_02470 [Rickettsiales bacterium]
MLRRGGGDYATIMLLSLGITEVATNHTPKLHILSTGNEITDDYAEAIARRTDLQTSAPYLLAAAR